MGPRSRIHSPARLLLTPIGRRRLLWGGIYRAWPLLRPIARIYRRIILRETRIVAVVGSFGKTTTTRAVMAALGLPYERHILWNAGGFLPIGLMRISRAMRFGVLEVGISRIGMMVRYAHLIEPDVVVVTSVGSEHNSTLGTLEVTRSEKSKIVEALPPSGLAVLNGDDPHTRWMGSRTQARVVTYGFDEGNDIRARDVSMDPDGRTRFRVDGAGTSRNAAIRLVGRHMVYPALAALAVSHEAGIPEDEALERLARLTPAPERMQPLRTSEGVLLLLDSKKAGLETIAVGLDVLREIPGERKIAVLGDIEEPPGPQGPLYKRIGADLAPIAAFIVFVGGRKGYRSLLSGARSAGLGREDVIYAGRTVRRAAALLRDKIREGDVVWIKGRSTQHLGRIGLELAGRRVACDIVNCPPTPTCATCPMLERKRRQQDESGP